MKRVHTPDMVAHLWAHQAQDEARTPTSNLYFQGPTVFSYGSHFPIARHTEKHGAAVLFTTRSYSVTTSKHLAIVRQACRHLNIIYLNNPNNSLDENLAFEDRQVDRAVQACAESRKGRSLEKKTEALQYALNQRNKLAEYMGARTRAMPEDMGEALAAMKRRDAGKKAAATLKAKKARAARLAAAEAKYGPAASWVEAWRLHKEVPSRYEWETATGAAMPCLLRLSVNGEEVQTSQGAEVPAAHARRIYNMWARLQGKLPPEGWVNNGDSQEGKVGAFKVDSIDVNGTIRAGCHTITGAEVAAFGEFIGWRA